MGRSPPTRSARPPRPICSIAPVGRALASAVALAFLTAGCGDESPDAETAPSKAAATQCREVDTPPVRDDGGASAPADSLAADKTYRLVVTTNCGRFTVTLDQESAPGAAASLVALARDGYFDGTIFHRIVPGFVIQGGDPTQSGAGGPGYSTVDPPAADARYTKGVVAMAKPASEAPGTAGSQFFVVTADDARLPPEYAVVGEVTEGLEVVELIGTLGDEAEQPTQTVLIESVTVEDA
jgi:peptidyl-prolyl cis-trans isomerase B (cyclophilin B)